MQPIFKCPFSLAFSHMIATCMLISSISPNCQTIDKNYGNITVWALWADINILAIEQPHFRTYIIGTPSIPVNFFLHAYLIFKKVQHSLKSLIFYYYYYVGGGSDVVFFFSKQYEVVFSNVLK